MLTNIQYELDLFQKYGYTKIAGVDEVGRGALAGPFVVCAAILNLPKLFTLFELIKVSDLNNTDINNDVSDAQQGNELYTSEELFKNYSKITDSKKISPKSREILNKFLLTEVMSYSIVEVSNSDLDKLGLSQTTQFAFNQAIKSLKTAPQHVLTDQFAIKNFPKEYQTNITKGDLNSITIGSASIIAKVYRDKIMTEMAGKYPEYGFEKHKGYGTKLHLQKILRLGPSTMHRLSFKLNSTDLTL